MKLLFLILLLPTLILSRELETCYRVYFWFLPVAESCVEYSKKGKTVRIRSWAKTVVVGRLVKRVNSWGEATLIDLRPSTFSLYQREGSYIRDHIYIFEKRGISYRIVRYKRDKKEVKEGFYESSVYLFDPFSTSFMVYIDTPNYRGGFIKVFYDGKEQSVRYRTMGEEKVEVLGRVYRTWKVVLLPDIETKGLLKPRGEWHIWVDKDTNIPVKLRVKFTIGSADILLSRMKGYRKLLLEVKYEQAGVLQKTSQ
ncbi:MAG: DUF3108 domain-containing protein [Aquificota bacterium]|nr:DUF3108 domain-containing protein [Aquificota bacterium]